MATERDDNGQDLEGSLDSAPSALEDPFEAVQRELEEELAKLVEATVERTRLWNMRARIAPHYCTLTTTEDS